MFYNFMVDKNFYKGINFRNYCLLFKEFYYAILHKKYINKLNE